EERLAFARQSRELGNLLRVGLEALGAVVHSPEGAGWIGSILSASFPGFAAEVLLHALEEEGVYVATTSACASRKGKTSAVLAALGLPEELLTSALRLSLSRETDQAQVERALIAIKETTSALRAAPTGGG
ncbi:MAG: cysteine desulfurase NifS, partial [Planctomycetes bacterium]|nr:cysteine desulfurase NifS [Planctomycetota bacterium]